MSCWRSHRTTAHIASTCCHVAFILFIVTCLSVVLGLFSNCWLNESVYLAIVTVKYMFFITKFDRLFVKFVVFNLSLSHTKQRLYQV